MVYIDLSIRCLFVFIHVIFVGSHVLQTVTPSSLALPVVFTLTSCPKGFVRGLDALAQDGVFDEAEVGWEDFFVDFIYDCDGVFGVCGEAAYLAPVASGALFLEALAKSVAGILSFQSTAS